MDEIIQLISSVGFPIACCCFLLWQMWQQDKYNREQQEKLRATIEANTRSIESLADLVKDLAQLVERRMKDEDQTGTSRKGK